MATQTDIYLTDEVKQLASKNPNVDVSGLLAIGANEAIALVIGALVLAFLFFFGQKLLASADIGGQGESKKNLRRTALAFVLLVVTTTAYSSVGGLKFDFSLKALKSTSNATSTSIIPDETIVNENDGGGLPLDPKNNNSLLEQMRSNEEQLRKSLPKSITINKPACTTIGQLNCTSIGGMAPATAAMLVQLQQGCNCDFVITGGTEWWTHSATTKHKPGNGTAVDIRFDTRGVNNFITNNEDFRSAKPWSICSRAYSWKGFYFCDERGSGGGARHWHIQPL